MGIDASNVPLNVGLYSFSDAARLVSSSPAALRRWLVGYNTPSGRAFPLWETEYANTDIKAIGFRDLLEVRLVREFRKYGLSLQIIRQAMLYAREVLHSRYPFTRKEFLTDGRSIFTTVFEKTGDESLVDIVKRQNVFPSIVKPGLYASIDFDSKGGALRWFPLARSRVIVVDPGLRFGQPVLADYGIPIVAIADALAAEKGNAELVARMFQVTKAAVLKASAFARHIAEGN
jgi:uncharacterized protein (DUF433 family)